ncbi:AMP phosphorylase [Candidatus Woesearchaeota archaeon]|nr:AMP phosphorylase [Candidatus Woesearchaeota archaeon]
MRLKVKNLGLSSGGPLIVVINSNDAKSGGLSALDRIRISYSSKEAIAVVNIASNKNVMVGEIGLFDEVIDKIKIREGSFVDVEYENKPLSLVYIKEKLNGKRLNEKQIKEIIDDIVKNKISEVEASYFIAGVYTRGLDDSEIFYMTRAIASEGKPVNWGKKIVLDKHSSGGTAGNRTTMIIVPIIAAAGFCIPKTSSRAITSPAGTADSMEVLAKVSFPVSKIKEIVNKTNGCIVWGGTLDLASADDRLIKIEKTLGLDPEGALLSSVLSKKKAVGATHVLIDIPYGEGAKIDNKNKARKLKKQFIKIGKRLGMKMKVILTDGSEPIGNGIGPALEARDVLKVLRCEEDAPIDLKEKAVIMAGLMLEMVGYGNEKDALEILESGEAYKKMKEIIKAQGGNENIKPDNIKIGKYSHVVESKKNGIVKNIDNMAINKIARFSGAPGDKGAGVYLFVHKGDYVNKGDELFAVYSNENNKLKYGLKLLKNEIISVG